MRLFFIAAILSCFLFVSCGDEAPTEPLTLTPAELNIVVDTATGNVTGAEQIKAFTGQKQLDLSEVIFTTSSPAAPGSPAVPAGCFGVDQTGVPRCNSGCGSSFNGLITATVKATATSTGAGNSASTIINCTFQ